MNGLALKRWQQLSGFSVAYIADKLEMTESELDEVFLSAQVEMKVVHKIVEAGFVDVFFAYEIKFKEQILISIRRNTELMRKLIEG